MHLTIRALQLDDRLLADHAPVGYDADRADTESLLQAVHHRNQRLHVGDIARPQLAAQRPSLAVQDRAHHHLLAVRAMVFAVSVLAQFRAPLPLEVDRRGVEEHQVQVTEQIAAAIEEGLLESILRRTRGKGRGPGLLLVGQAFSQPCHGAIDVMQIHRFDPRDGVALFPVQHARAIAAGDKQTMQDGQKENPLQRDSKASAGQQPPDDLRDLQLVPEPPKDQCRADAAVADGGHIAATMRGEHHHGCGELGSRLE